MKALQLSEYMKLEIVDVEEPAIGPDDVLVAVHAAGICGSDVHGIDGGSGRRIPPIIMGHEAAGSVAALGSNVERFKVNDRVTFDSMISCRSCHQCAQGRTNLCETRRVLGVSCDTYHRQGAFADYIAVPQHILYGLPDGLTYERAAMVEPVSVAVHAVGLMSIDKGSTAVVVGVGTIGLLVIQALRVAGCDHVIAVDLDETKLDLADEVGAARTLNAGIVDSVAEVLALTDGRGVDVAMEVVGNSSALQTAVDCAKLGGQVGLVGNVQPVVDLALQKVVTRELSLVGSCASAGEYSHCLDLMAAGQIDVAPLISQVAPLDQGAEFFRRLHDQEPGLTKVILRPPASNTHNPTD